MFWSIIKGLYGGLHFSLALLLLSEYTKSRPPVPARPPSGRGTGNGGQSPHISANLPIKGAGGPLLTSGNLQLPVGGRVLIFFHGQCSHRNALPSFIQPPRNSTTPVALHLCYGMLRGALAVRWHLVSPDARDRPRLSVLLLLLCAHRESYQRTICLCKFACYTCYLSLQVRMLYMLYMHSCHAHTRPRGIHFHIL